MILSENRFTLRIMLSRSVSCTRTTLASPRLRGEGIRYHFRPTSTPGLIWSLG
jgi:hypothetical protein